MSELQDLKSIGRKIEVLLKLCSYLDEKLNDLLSDVIDLTEVLSNYRSTLAMVTVDHEGEIVSAFDKDESF